jgi:enoyl-CoA hydratase/carnithine racemase
MSDREPAVLFDQDGDVAVLVLNRPRRRNAISPEMATQLEAALDRLESDPALRVGVLAGAGERAFCSGADLNYVAAGQGDRLSTARGGLGGLVRYRRSKPLIAAVHGYAVAGGFELALACDLVVAERTARFGLPEVTRGLIANGGGILRLLEALPRARALDLLLTGRLLDAAEAAALGLVSRVVEPGQARTEAIALAATIAAQSAGVVRETLELANTLGYRLPDISWRLVAEVAARVRNGDDAVERAAAFVEHRAPGDDREFVEHRAPGEDREGDGG